MIIVLVINIYHMYCTIIYIKFLMSLLLIMSWNISLKFSTYALPREGTGFCRILIISQAVCFCVVFSPTLEKKIAKLSLL